MQTKDSLQTYTIMEKSEAEACLDLAVSLVRENLNTFTRCFPDSNSRNQFYPQSSNREWTTGFWTGETWPVLLLAGLLKVVLLKVKMFMHSI